MDNAAILSIEKEEVNLANDTGVAEEQIIDFPWPLITTGSIYLGGDQKQSHFIRDTIVSPRVRLILWGISLLLSLISGVLGLAGSCSHEETITFLLVQAMFGAYFVLVNAARVWPKYIQKTLLGTTDTFPSASVVFLAMADLVVIFCIVWFLIGHMWAYSNRNDYCNVAISGMTLAICLLHYIMAVWSFIAFLFDSPTILRSLETRVQFRLDYLSEEYLLPKETHSNKSSDHTEKGTLSMV